MVMAAAVSALLTLNVAARPAAIKTGQVATAFTVAQLLFLATRFANLFYAPLMGAFIDEAEASQQLDRLYGQLQWVIAGSAAGALISWLLLPTAIELFCRGVRCIQHRGSMTKALMRLVRPSGWKTALMGFRRPSNLGVKWFSLEGVPPGFLIVNVLATGIWTVGVLAALYVSGAHKEFDSTAILLSGLVNGIAAIIFSVWVDPKAALITDQAKNGKIPEKHVRITAVHLAMGNFVGGLLAFFLFDPAIAIIEPATLRLGQLGETLAGFILPLILLNVIFTLLASTTHSSRVSAVVTRNVATAIAIYNLFFLVTRLAMQIYAPVLGAVRDYAMNSPNMSVDDLFSTFQWVLGGAAIGALVGWMLMPTFVEVYNWAIRVTDERGSVARMLGIAILPWSWKELFLCFRLPSFMGVTWANIKSLPKGFLIGNVVVIGIHTCGVVAAIYAGAMHPDIGRTAVLLSSVVNGLATITLSIIVDPTVARITDQAVDGERPLTDVKAAAVALMATMFLGTLAAQVFLYPASQVVSLAAMLLDKVF